uniref:Uncharacterized protein n=1 Tax=Oryza meridionalis TaxID=40149 RepID=A0A0E0ELE5_9ORYZ
MVWLGVGDEALEAIGSSCSALENLSLDNLNKCSDSLLLPVMCAKIDYCRIQLINTGLPT